jgi:cation diffusion facilitator family transporter
MHGHSIEKWRHDHVFLGAGHARNERRTWAVVVLTACMMVVEIVAGLAFGSMALIADGLHMSTHAGALAIAGLAYWFARRKAHDPRFAFGTGKLGELAGFASANILAVVALLIGVESVLRIMSPVAISFDQAIAVAVLGLGVNLVSAWMLHGGDGAGHGHDHGHDHGHGHRHAAHEHTRHGDHGHAHHGHSHDHHRHRHAGAAHSQDHNMRSAYAHVLADALTSVLAIVGLLVARFNGWLWIDPLMGIVGAVIIATWSWRLIRESGAVLLDVVPDPDLAERVRERLEVGGDRVSDLHLWRVGPGHCALIAAIVSDHPEPAEAYKARLAPLRELSHSTIEVHRCPGPEPLAA